MEAIRFYEQKMDFLSNFSAFAIEYRRMLWPTAEHAYQARKFSHGSIQKRIRDARSPYAAKQIAQMYSQHRHSDWENIKLGCMEEILRTKLAQHRIIREGLLTSGTIILVEDSPYDSFWGCGSDNKGHNHLGKLWMKIRAELREAKNEETTEHWHHM